MRFEVHNLKELKDAVKLMSEDDRISFNFSKVFLNLSLPIDRVSFHVTDEKIIFHDVRLDTK